MSKKRHNGDFGRACGNIWRDIKCMINRNTATGLAFGLAGPWPPVRIAICVMIALVLLFSGISITSWLILGILVILLNFC